MTPHPEISIAWPEPAAGPTTTRLYRVHVRGSLAAAGSRGPGRAELSFDFPLGRNMQEQLDAVRLEAAVWRDAIRDPRGENAMGFRADGLRVTFFDAGGVERDCLLDGEPEI